MHFFRLNVNILWTIQFLSHVQSTAATCVAETNGYEW